MGIKNEEITLTLEIDFNMLDRQKEVLLKRLYKEGTPESMLWGLVHMIDDIQDEAERQGLWKFPDDTGKDLEEVKKDKVVTKRKETTKTKKKFKKG